jgi:hypothetical protein
MKLIFTGSKEPEAVLREQIGLPSPRTVGGQIETRGRMLVRKVCR